MNNIYNVIIIGAGKIGAFFDTPSSEKVFTHAHAFSNNKFFNLLGFIDKDYSKAVEAANIWKSKSFKSIEEAFSDNKIDIVSVCVPDEFHYEVMETLSTYDIKVIFLEKPISRSLSQAKKLLYLYKNKAILVNYSRRFVKEFEQIRNDFNIGLYGKLLVGNAYYGKGIIHNGSHLINLLTHILGKIESVQTLSVNFDFYDDDPSVTGILKFKDNSILTINNLPCNAYTIFEIDLLFEKKRIRIVDSGFFIESYEVVKSEIFKDYINLSLNDKYETELAIALENSLINIYNYLEYGEKLKCTLHDAYETMSICDELRWGVLE